MSDFKFPSETTTKATPVEADVLLIADSADSNSIKDVTIAEVRDDVLIDDSSTATTKIWSASKVNTELGTKAASSHTHNASDIDAGTLADARVVASNVTQHQAALAVTKSQISDAETTLVTPTNSTDGTYLDGDKIDIDFTPTSYTPDDSISEADDVDDLSAHLKGIDDEIGILKQADYDFIYDYMENGVPSGSSTVTNRNMVYASSSSVPVHITYDALQNYETT